jgi:hypothetical protein
MRQKRRFRAATVAMLAVVLGVGWWAISVRYSQAEQRLVGTWEHRHNPIPEAPNGVIKVWLLSEDRSCRVEVVDAANGQLLDAMNGRWRVQGVTLVCGWEGSPLNSFDTNLDPYVIESVTSNEVVLRPRGGPVTYSLRRVVGR